MFWRQQSRLRFALVLAISLATWSDLAVAAFLCPHISGCPDQATNQVATNASNKTTQHAGHSSLGLMPCCPKHGQTAWQCDMAVRDCCIWKHNDPPPAAVQDASRHPAPNHAIAISPAVIALVPSLATDPWPRSSDSAPLFIKPVNQKKTDLRI
jgi:hypothetical protein